MHSDPVRVSVYCGGASKCVHGETPQLARFACTPSLIANSSIGGSSTSRLSSSSELASPSWPLLRCVSTNEQAIECLSGELASIIARQVNCSTVIVFSSLHTRCKNDKCVSKHHVVDVFCDDHIGPLQQRLLDTGMLCHHSENPFVRMALEQKCVIISNDPASDVRLTDGAVRHTAPPRESHFSVKNIMVMPLMVVVGDVTRNVGFVLCTNSNNLRPQPYSISTGLLDDEGHSMRCVGDDGEEQETQTHCHGFQVTDYTAHHHALYSLSVHMLVAFQDREMVRLGHVIDAEKKRHKEELRKVSLSRDTFVGTMSHEIRTPLFAINGYNEIMMANEVTGANAELFAKWLRKQRDATLQLTQLLANMLDFAKLKSDSVRLTSRPFHIEECLARAVDMCAQQCLAKNISLHTHVDDSVPKTLVGDDGRFYQVLLNLLTNAAKFTLHGSISITVRLAEDDGATLRTSHDDSNDDFVRLLVSVSDTGRGVPRALQQSIFNEFKQVRDTTATNIGGVSVQGVGLGLAICRELVTLMRGKIWVESDGRSGSTFLFTVRMRDQETVETMTQTAQELMANGAVLIVDDVETNRITLMRMVSRWKLVPHACGSLEESIALLETFSPTHFRVILLDIDLDGVSGVTLARRIAHDVTFAHIIIIATSSMGSAFDGSELFDSIHEKPVREEDLLADITRLLRSGTVRRQFSSSSPPSSLSSSLSSSSSSSSSSSLSSAKIVHKTRRHQQTTPKYPILLVDDDESSLTVTSYLLKQLGYTDTTLAHDGYEALSILERSPHKFTCIFMDVVMPRLSGIECTQFIRREPQRYGTAPVIILTADAVDATRTNAFIAGAKECLNKPVGLDRLREVMSTVLTTATTPTATTKTPQKKRSSKRKNTI